MLCFVLSSPASFLKASRAPDACFSQMKDASGPSRGSIVCSRCWDVYDYFELSVDLEPVCEDLPRGVEASSEGMTLASFNLEEGYYRISADSHSVLECDKEEACVGGDTVGQYCAPGYQGPCKCARICRSYASGAGYPLLKTAGAPNAKRTIKISGTETTPEMSALSFCIADASTRPCHKEYWGMVPAKYS